MKKKLSSIFTTITLLVILAIGFSIRVYNIDSAKNVDEPNIVKRAVQVADGQMHIKWYNWPAQSLIRIDGLVFKAAQPFLNYHQPIKQTVGQLYEKNKNIFNTIAHAVTVFFAIISIFLIFLIGQKINNSKTGLLAAFFLAVNYLHSLHSHYATPDVPLAFAFLLSIYIAILIYFLPLNNNQKREYWLYAAAGAVLGFAVATKYTGALTILPTALVYVYRLIKSKNWQLKKVFGWSCLLFIGGALVVHTILNPFFFFDLKIILKNIIFEAKPDRLGVDWSGANNKFFLNFFYYLKSSLGWNGTCLSIIAYLTMLLGIAKFNKHKWLLLNGIFIFFLILLIGLSTLGLHWSRWAVPFSPLMDIFAAFGLINFAEYLLKKIKYKKMIIAASALLIAMIIFPQILVSIVTGASFKTTTSAKKMAAYVNENVPANSKIVADTYYLDIDENKFQLEKKMTGLIFYKTTLSEYQADNVDYLVVKPKRNSYASKQPKLYQNIITFHEELDKNGQAIVTYKNNEGLLKKKKDFAVYDWLWHNKLKDALDICRGTTLVLYKI